MASVEITVTPTPPPGVEQYLTSVEGGITIILGLVGIGGFLYGAYKITLILSSRPHHNVVCNHLLSLPRLVKLAHLGTKLN